MSVCLGATITYVSLQQLAQGEFLLLIDVTCCIRSKLLTHGLEKMTSGCLFLSYTAFFFYPAIHHPGIFALCRYLDPLEKQQNAEAGDLANDD